MRDEVRLVVVTGVGAVSGFGRGVDPLWKGLLAAEAPIAPITAFDSSIFRSDLASEVDWAEVVEHLRRAEIVDVNEEATQIAVLSFLEACSAAELSIENLRALGDRAGLVVGTLCSSTRRQEQLWQDQLAGRPSTMEEVSAGGRFSCVDYQVDRLSRLFEISGPAMLVSTACASGVDAFGMGLDLIGTGKCDTVLIGGGDILSCVVHAGFNSVYSITKTHPRPFDRDRDGFVIGEGAGALVLEAEETARARGAPILARALGYGASNSAVHLTAPSETGIAEAKALRRALDDSGVAPRDISFVLAHGTATRRNDETEIKAITQVLGGSERDSPLVVASIKGSIGHCMGAAGALSLVAAVQALRTGWAPPTAGLATLDKAIEQSDFLFFAKGQPAALRPGCAMVNAFGFGGCNASAVLGPYDG